MIHTSEKMCQGQPFFPHVVKTAKEENYRFLTINIPIVDAISLTQVSKSRLYRYISTVCCCLEYSLFKYEFALEGVFVTWEFTEWPPIIMQTIYNVVPL